MNKAIFDLHARAVEAAILHKKSESDLISILQELDGCRGYLHFNASSLYGYCVRILKLSESTSYNLITVARKSREVPALKKAIESGEITLSKARKIAPVLNEANRAEWLALAKTETSRNIEKAVAKENPRLTIKESVRYRAEDRIELRVGISEELLKKLERICDLESQRQSKPVSREEALLAAAEIYLEKNDPLKKAERAIRCEAATTNCATKPAPGQVQRVKKKIVVSELRSHIPAAVMHAVTMRDQRQCTHQDQNGERCKNKRWLEAHHIQPKSLGGKDTLENLTTLCSSHHSFLHRTDRQAGRE